MPLSKKRIGIVCPYGWDTPGGVQSHVGDLAEYLIRQGHYVSVLAPAIDEDNLPDYVTSAGRPIAILLQWCIRVRNACAKTIIETTRPTIRACLAIRGKSAMRSVSTRW